MNRMTFKVQNTKRNGCTSCIFKSLSSIEGIDHINIGSTNENIEFSYKDEANLLDVKSDLSKRGFVITEALSVNENQIMDAIKCKNRDSK